MIRNTLPLALFAIACNGGGGGGKPTVTREINAAFSPDGTEALLVVSSYRTRNPDAPYFAADNATDWTITLFATDATLADRREIGAWDEMTGQGGGLQYHHVHWLPQHSLFVGLNTSQVVLYEDGGELVSLPTPYDAIAPFVGGLAAADFAYTRHVVPSPDGSQMAVFWSVPEDIGGFDFDFTHLVAFHDLPSGARTGLYLIPMSNRNWEIRLEPVDTRLGTIMSHLLWDKDGSGIFAINSEEAWHIATNGTPTLVTEVPAVPAPTTGGRVADDGRLLRLIEDGNEATMTIEATPGWVPFADVARVPLSEIVYAL